jgi:6-phosphogluconolactonase
MKFLEYPDREMLAMDLADTLAGELNAALMNHDTVSFAVPGGTTPGPVFDMLCGARLDWARVHVMLTDERWVPEDDPRSNTRLLRERLLIDRAAEARLVPLFDGSDSPEAGAAALAAGVAAELPISVLLLGMGDDMHTASLFPGAEGLEAALDAGAPPLAAIRAEGAGAPRITLTAPVLKGAMSTHLVITGAEKRAALERARAAGDPRQAPVAAVLGHATVHWAE